MRKDLRIMSLISQILDLSFLNNSGLHLVDIKDCDVTRLNYLLNREKESRLVKMRFKAIDVLNKNKNNSELIHSVYSLTSEVKK